jgi:hypothetical protein
MNSQFFISEAKSLLRDINDHQVKSMVSTVEEQQAEMQALQKRAHSLLAGMVNPTLPSAFNLVDRLLELGWPVEQKALHLLGAGERMYHG